MASDPTSSALSVMPSAVIALPLSILLSSNVDSMFSQSDLSVSKYQAFPYQDLSFGLVTSAGEDL